MAEKQRQVVGTLPSALRATPAGAAGATPDSFLPRATARQRGPLGPSTAEGTVPPAVLTHVPPSASSQQLSARKLTSGSKQRPQGLRSAQAGSSPRPGTL